MRLARYDSAERYLNDWRATLAENEVANGLILGIALRLVEKPDAYGDPPVHLGIFDGDAPVVAGLMTPPHKLLLRVERRERREAAFALIVDDLARDFPELPGVNGAREDSLAFADLWRAARGCEARTHMRLRCFELTGVIDPPRPPGESRPATRDDLERVLEWTMAFMGDTGVSSAHAHDREHVLPMVERYIDGGWLRLWTDGGRPVAMAGASRGTGNGKAVNLVYTPPAARRRGYATALVADVSRRVLDEGCRFVTLFTDLANPTSNSIYRKIGYRPVVDFEEIGFEYGVAPTVD